MHRAVSARCLTRALRIREAPSLLSATPPTFLCPGIIFQRSSSRTGLAVAPAQRRRLHIEPTSSLVANDAIPSEEPELKATPEQLSTPPPRLPVACAGCGALSQTHDDKQLGFYNVKSKRIQKWLRPDKFEAKDNKDEEDAIVSAALEKLGADELEALDINPSRLKTDEQLPGQDSTAKGSAGAADGNKIPSKPPVCERCHSLTHHGLHGSATADVPMYHPTVDSLRETIEESPHRYNHIYHVIDAADFPMSLIPRLNVLLGDIPLRSRNRRSRAHKYVKDRKIEMSFVITRGDLLGPTKEKVDHMMPYLRDVLRDALGRLGGRIRLGNLRCVSAKRSWWTSKLKEDIWNRGGAGWMVGKVNVGKSQLFEAVYPKGRMTVPAPKRDGEHAVSVYAQGQMSPAQQEEQAAGLWNGVEQLDEFGLLPPLQPAQQYPDMPIVSDLPGTTASPIRVPFGNKKGELIDLPGLARSDLELFVKPEHRKSLIMKSRIVPEQLSFTEGNSLLLGGGLIRITPRTPDIRFLMYNFTPLREHLTSTVKAVDFQNQTRVSPGVENISLPGIGDKMALAGTYQLKHDVTKGRAGPLTRRSAVGLKVENLPFRVLSVDILIEGVGYVEIVAQVRAKDLRRKPIPAGETPVAPANEQKKEKELEEDADPFAVMMSQRRDADSLSAPAKKAPTMLNPHGQPRDDEEQLGEPEWPAIDVFSPEGRFIGSRMPIEGWLNNKPLVKPEHKRSRPRKSMRGQKKQDKMERRAAGGA